MSYISANKALSNRLQDDMRGSNRRRSSILANEIISGTSTTRDGLMFDIPPRERQAKFEEWIKLTTDNKINTSNSWAVALIDYFHDMEVFRDGDGINFQKASTTLDGCVKVYSSRIDSVITETGKLLSGLATKKDGEEDEEGEGEDGDESDEDGEKLEGAINEAAADSQKGSKKSKQKSDSTLKRWKEIKMRSLDQELAIDPLFKKTLAEFDEGGAKSLLMHMLTVDKNVRIMFDTSTGSSPNFSEGQEDQELLRNKKNRPIRISSLKAHLFGAADTLELDDSLELCPSLDRLESVVGDIEKAKTVLKDIHYDTSYNMSVNSLRANDTIGSMSHAAQAVLLNDNFDDFGSAPGGDFDGNDDDDDENDADGDRLGQVADNETSAIFANTTAQDSMDDTELDNRVLNYFDEALKSNWTGPVHWKVRALSGKFGDKMDESESNADGAVKQQHDLEMPKAKKQKKEEFKVDFFSEEIVDDEDIFTVRKSSKINTVLKEAEDFHLLPDDTFFSSKNLIHLFTKEDQTLKLFKVKKTRLDGADVLQEDLPDEKFWADNYDELGPTGDFEGGALDAPLGGAGGLEDDDDDDDDVANDVDLPESQEFGTQLLPNSKSKGRRTVNFARVAKRVDLSALKNNIWRSIQRDETSELLEFKDIVKSTVKIYPAEEKKDLSTSFEFIALLHLANEKGFTIETNDDHSNLFIKLAEQAQ